MIKIIRNITRVSVLLTTCLLSSCSLNNSNKYKDYMGIALTQFEDSLFSHFPDKIEGAYTLKFISAEKCKEKGHCCVFLLANLPSDQISQKRDELIKQGHVIRTFSDSSNIIINIETPNKLKRYETVPIPNLPKIFNNSELLIKQEKIDIMNFDIFVLDAKPGIFVEKELLSETKNLPEDWKNGYNKGIAINSSESQILFWFEIW